MTAPTAETPPGPTTVGELRASGHRERSVKQEIRENLLAALAGGGVVWPGIFGFEDTVLPQLERALIAGHDMNLLGERGQGKTRLLRSLASLLDEWTPVIAGAELGEHPYSPITPESIRGPRNWATICRSAGGTAAGVAPAHPAPGHQRGQAWSVTSTRSRWPRVAPWVIRRPSPTA